jgi:hypothetical protein
MVMQNDRLPYRMVHVASVLSSPVLQEVADSLMLVHVVEYPHGVVWEQVVEPV